MFDSSGYCVIWVQKISIKKITFHFYFFCDVTERKEMSFRTKLWLEMKLGFTTSNLKQNVICSNGNIAVLWHEQSVELFQLFDKEDVAHTEFMPKSATINASSYCETLKRWRKSLKNRRPGKLSKDIVLLHNNARPHAAK